MQDIVKQRTLIKYIRDPHVLKGDERNLQVQEIVQNLPFDVVKEMLNINLCQASIVDYTEFSSNINDLGYRSHVFSLLSSAIDNGYLDDRNFVVSNIRYLKCYYHLTGVDTPKIVDDEYFKHLYLNLIRQLKSLTETNHIQVCTILGLKDMYNELGTLGLMDDELYTLSDAKGKVIYNNFIDCLHYIHSRKVPSTYRELFGYIEQLVMDFDTYFKLKGGLLDFYKDVSSSNYYKLRKLYDRTKYNSLNVGLVFKGKSGSTLAKFNRYYNNQIPYDEFLAKVECN